MKKAVAVLLTLVLIIGATPARADYFRYFFSSIDDNKTYEAGELIGNWIGAVEPDWQREFELDIGDLAASATGTVENVGDVISPTVSTMIPLRSYIVGEDGIVRVFDVLVSNMPEDFSPRNAPSTISNDDMYKEVVGFEALASLFHGEDAEGNKVEITNEEFDAFRQKYADQMTNIYTAVDYYMRAAGYDKEDYGNVDSVAKAMLIVSKYFPIGEKLLEYLDDTDNATRYIYLCAELYKGFYATFLRDEVTMAEFSTVVYLWSLNLTPQDEKGSPYAFVVYIPEEKRWVLTDVFQAALVGDLVHTSEVMNIIVDIRYFMSADADTLALGLRYDSITGVWVISGMNRAAYLLLASGGTLPDVNF